MQRPGSHAMLSFAALLFAAVPTGASAQDASYRVTLGIDRGQELFVGRVTVRLPDATAGDTLELEVGRPLRPNSLGVPIHLLNVRTTTGDRLEPIVDSENGIARVVLPARLVRDETLSIDYSIPFNPVALRYQGHYMFRDRGPGSRWFPVVRTGTSRFDLEAEIELPIGYAGLTCFGALRAETEPILLSGTVTDKEGCFAVFGDGLELNQRRVGSTTITVLDDPKGVRPITGALDHAEAALRWYIDSYGFFPFPHIGIVPASMGSVGATAWPGLVWLHRGDLSPEFLEQLIAHEIGHFYWGLHVRDAGGDRFGWLTLANGIWADHRYLSARRGRTFEEHWLQQEWFNRFEEYLTARTLGYDQRLSLTSDTWSQFPYNYNSTVRHGKGAVGIYLLSQRIGVESFLALQRSLLRELGGQPLTEARFAEALEEHGLSEAREWMETWSRGDASVEYAVRHITDLSDEGGRRYRIDIEQTGTMAHSIEVGIHDSAGGLHLIETKGTGPIEIELPAPILDVSIDPNSRVPMFSSHGIGMRRLVLAVRLRTTPNPDDLALARTILRNADGSVDSRLLFALVGAAFGMGRFEEVVDVWDRRPATCHGIDECRAALDWAESLIRLGRRTEAQDALGKLEESTDRTALSERHDRLVALVNGGG